MGTGMGQRGSMNNHPLRGGKGGYFEGGVRVASFVHSPLLPDRARGTSVDAMLSIADWYATFAHGIAGLAASDDAADPSPMPAALEAAGAPSLPAPYGCREHAKCTFPSDSIDFWPLLTGANATPPRAELMLGLLDGGALLDAGGLKYVTGVQAPD